MKTFEAWWKTNWSISGTKLMKEAAESAWNASAENSVAEISRLKGVIAKCKLGINQYLKDHPHSPPYDCYATGPITGSPVFDLVRCPGCDADTNFKKALTAIKEIES